VTATARAELVSRALFVEELSSAWMLVEGGLSLAIGVLAQSVAVIGFGADRALELGASVTLYHRRPAELRDLDREGSARHERRAPLAVGVTMLLLALCIAVDASCSLCAHRVPENGPVGLAVAAVALVVMPVMARSKRRLGVARRSRALIGDAKESRACAWLSAAVVADVGLHWAFGSWCADPVATLAVIPFLVREGQKALEQGRDTPLGCGHDCEKDGGR
jgi:divalent metal cation (Fe/Co/Zn/Cd) transporter